MSRSEGSARRFRSVAAATVYSLLVVVAPGCARGAQIPEAQGSELSSTAQTSTAQISTAGKSEARLVDLSESFSEPGGYFDTDNLISNEGSYGSAVARLTAIGGAYIGVGPEQNFSYIARTRPRWAFLVDVRRDNLLQHLLLNAILDRAPTPYGYLCLLFSRDCMQADLGGDPLESAELDPRSMIEKLEAANRDSSLRTRNFDGFLRRIEGDLGFVLSASDRRTLAAVLDEFFVQQLDLRFRSHGRPARGDYPSYRDLLLERRPDGGWASFLADPAGYSHLRELARSGRLVPVVGDLAGPDALRAIARYLEQQGERVTTLYVSNVEFYLMRSPSAFASYLGNLRALPLADDGILIRSYFDYGMSHPLARPGERSTLVLERAKRFLELEAERPYRSYWDVCTRDYLE